MEEKIRFGIIGTSKISSKVLEGARQDSRYEAVAIYSRRQETADEYALKHGIPHTFTDLEQMASSPLIDAVYIASPNFLHAPQAILCMNHGKHVLCEKPLASNAREVRQMIEAARANGVLLMEAMITTTGPNFKVVQDYLPRLGTLRRYFASYCQYSSRYDKFKEGVVLNAFKPELSNGSVMDIGIYTIYPMVALFGKPTSIDAQGVLLSSGADGQGAVNFQYPGMNATVLYSKIANSSLPTEIEGEEGNLLLDQIHIITGVSYQPRQSSGWEHDAEPVTQRVGVETPFSPYYYEVKEFIDVLQRGALESSVNTLQTSLTTIEIIDEIRRQIGVVYPADN